ncbi:coiled-coil domain-containing protein 94 [Moniliophthora roreri]|nr:coiled-coil domain-containing protein 94 [Moniliophthora roreri]
MELNSQPRSQSTVKLRFGRMSSKRGEDTALRLRKTMEVGYRTRLELIGAAATLFSLLPPPLHVLHILTIIRNGLDYGDWNSEGRKLSRKSTSSDVTFGYGIGTLFAFPPDKRHFFIRENVEPILCLRVLRFSCNQFNSNGLSIILHRIRLFYLLSSSVFHSECLTDVTFYESEFARIRLLLPIFRYKWKTDSYLPSDPDGPLRQATVQSIETQKWPSMNGFTTMILFMYLSLVSEQLLHD